MTTQTCWFVPQSDLDWDSPKVSNLQPADTSIADTDIPIEMGGSFTISLESFYVHGNYEGDDKGENDILIKSRVRYGAEQATTEVINFFGKDIPAGTFKNDLEFEHIYYRRDYDERDRLWLELDVIEVDKGLDQDNALLNNLSAISNQFGNVFSALVPLSNVATTVVNVVRKIRDFRSRNKQIIKSNLDLYGLKGGAGEAKLRCGAYIFFSQPVEGIQYKLGRGFRLERSAPSQQDVPILDDYTVVKIEAGIINSGSQSIDDALANQQLATVLSQIDETESTEDKQQHLMFLLDVIRDAAKFKELEYFRELNRKQKRFPSEVTQSQKERLLEIEDKLSKFIPSDKD